MNRYTVVNWTAPFTLDVADIIPAFTYSIRVKYSFDEGKIVSVHNHTDDGYIVRSGESSPCGRFDITVTPVNGAGNGTSETIVGYLFTSVDSCVVTTTVENNCSDLMITTGNTFFVVLIYVYIVRIPKPCYIIGIPCKISSVCLHMQT